MIFFGALPLEAGHFPAYYLKCGRYAFIQQPVLVMPDEANILWKSLVKRQIHFVSLFVRMVGIPLVLLKKPSGTERAGQRRNVQT